MADLWVPESELMKEYKGQIESVEFGNHHVAAVWTDISVRGKFGAIGGKFDIPPGELEQKFLEEYMYQQYLYEDEQLVFCSAMYDPIKLRDIDTGDTHELDFFVGITYTGRRPPSYEPDHDTLAEVADRIPEMRDKTVIVYLAMSKDKWGLLDISKGRYLTRIPEAQYHTAIIKGCMDGPQENTSKHNPIIVFFIEPNKEDTTKI